MEGKAIDFKLKLSLAQLKKRTSSDYLKAVTLMTPKDKEYLSLSSAEKSVLMYLVKAAQRMDRVHYMLDNQYNLEFDSFLDDEIKAKNERAKLTKILFHSQKGMFSPDYEGNKIALIKNFKEPLGLNFYPEDLTVKEFHSILNSMLDDKKIDEVRSILSQRTVVRWQDNSLVGIDYVTYFADELKGVAEMIVKASEQCQKCNDKDMAEYLILQAKALTKVDEKLDAKADKKWASIIGSKFEFTITRESYNDRLTASIFDNKKLHKKLKDAQVEPLFKDNLGARVGLVNKEGTKVLEKLSALSDVAKNFMPHRERYKKSTETNDAKQNAIDVDVITLTGDEGAFRAGIVLAQNLPNNDKLSIKMGGGRKNVYHRQIRKSSNKPFAKEILDKKTFAFYNDEALHWATICHENTHSLGPVNNNLGRYTAIFEEFKADMGMFAFLREFEKEKLFTSDQVKQIIVSEIITSMLKAKPNITQAHRVRSVMIINRMFIEKAIDFNDNQLSIDFGKVINTSQILMDEIIDLQLSLSANRAKKYLKKYFKWTKQMSQIAAIKRRTNKHLNGTLKTPLADYLLKIK